MEIAQFIWSSQTVLTERDEWLRGRSIAVLETPLLDLPPQQIFVSVVRRVTRSQVDFGHVVSNSSKRCRGRWCEFNPSFKDIALSQLPTKKHEVQKMSWNVVSSFWLVLFYWGGYAYWGEHQQGNMTRRKWAGEIYIASFLLLLLLFQPRTSLLQSKLPPPFQTVSNNEGLCSFFSLKRTKEAEKSGKLINLDPHLSQHLITCSLGSDH